MSPPRTNRRTFGGSEGQVRISDCHYEAGNGIMISGDGIRLQLPLKQAANDSYEA